MEDNYLSHHGVKGMKWGKRKNYYGQSGDKFKASNGVTVGAPKNVGVAAFRKVQGTKAGGAALNGMAKMNTAFYGRKNKTQWRRVENQVRKENQAVREANQAHKNALNKTYEEINKKTSFGEKLLYNGATRKKAAKYVVNNNMSMEEARKKANKQAFRNTAVLIGAYSGITVTALYKMSH